MDSVDIKFPVEYVHGFREIIDQSGNVICSINKFYADKPGMGEWIKEKLNAGYTPEDTALRIED